MDYINSCQYHRRCSPQVLVTVFLSPTNPLLSWRSGLYSLVTDGTGSPEEILVKIHVDDELIDEEETTGNNESEEREDATERQD